MSCWPLTITSGDAVLADVSAEPWKRVNFPRILTAISMAGGSAAGDTEIELQVNGFPQGRFRNVATGYPTNDHIKRVQIPVPANSLLGVIIRDAAPSNVNVVLDFVP